MPYDDEIEVNFDPEGQNDDRPWENMAPAGWYLVRVDKIELKHGKDSGKPYWATKLRHDGEPRLLIDENFFFTDKAVWKLKRLYKALNLEHHGVLKIRSADVLGKEVMAFLVPGRNMNGEPRMEVGKQGYKDPEEQRAGVPDRPDPVTYKPRAVEKEVPF